MPQLIDANALSRAAHVVVVAAHVAVVAHVVAVVVAHVAVVFVAIPQADNRNSCRCRCASVKEIFCISAS